MNRRTICAAALVWLVSFGATFAQEATMYAGARLNFRTAPHVDSAVIAVLPAGAMLTVGPCVDGWCPARNGGRAGFVARSLLVRDKPLRALVGMCAFNRSDGKLLGRIQAVREPSTAIVRHPDIGEMTVTYPRNMTAALCPR